MSLGAMTSRTFAGAEDLRHIVDLLLRVRPAERIADYPSPTDLNELLSLPAVQANTRFWSDKEQIIAFALVDPYNNLLFECQGATPDLQSEIINWGVECIRRKPHRAEEPLTLDASCREEDSDRIALLEQHGFVRQPVRSLRLARPVREPIPPPTWPGGFEIRTLKGRDEVQEWVQLHRAAFGTEQMTVEERLAMMSGTDYDPDLDLVMVGPDGRLAAYCMCQIFREENARTGRNEGYTDPVATHPQYQGRGLAKALLSTGLRLLQKRGVETAIMGTSSENEKMQRAAKAVGFRMESATVWFAKPV
ncbi:MAG: GNAT family N-acetyltransferase [Anaerolineae bacterium]|nr:GNAT family N-acetyltransferase [Anaerolineae bacterium]